MKKRKPVWFILCTVVIWLMVVGLFTLRDALGQQIKAPRPTDPPQIDKPSPPFIASNPAYESWGIGYDTGRGIEGRGARTNEQGHYKVYDSPNMIVTIWTLAGQSDCDWGVLQFRSREEVPVSEIRATGTLGWRRATEE